MSTIGQRVSAWLALARLPFHSVGVLPFVLGMVLAWRLTGAFRWDVGLWGVAGVVLVMLATYFAGEYWDYEEDTIAGELGGSRFAGGSQMVQQGRVSRGAPLWASLVSVALAIGVAVILQFGYGTGPWTLPFMAVALLGGFFYSARPVRWVSTGLGELWIAFCYGWLPVAVGYYLQAGDIPPVVHWMSIPIGLTIFNVILLNEFPDHLADAQAGKRNLTVRLGPERAALVYGFAGVGAWAGMLVSLTLGVPLLAGLLYLPVLALSVVLVTLVVRGGWRDRGTLERLCGATILVNLGTTAVYIVAFLLT
ncbi:MAG: prenyltransferase [Chloroflexi bacterium]|nr:prenyltransferase [Chloroflexota bacterium]MBU1750328.1 prenyltransferase [Chloroflexota bacterium]